MNARMRSFVALVMVFAVLAAGVLWWQTLRSQTLLRQQVLLQAEQRSLHLADAMAGQVQAQLGMLDVSLKDLRDHWLIDSPKRFDTLVREKLSMLPPGFVSHVSVANAKGTLVYNSLGLETGVFVGDRPHFQALREGPDRLQVSTPVRSRLNGKWVFLVGRPIWRMGRFDGVLYLLVESAFFANKLGALELSDQDVVSLIHPDGSFLARSLNNEASMGQRLPADRPFLAQAGPRSGTYRVAGADDHIARTYGWYRLPDLDLVVAIGLADSSVLAPLEPSFARSRLLAGVLSLLVLAGGGAVAFLLWRVARSQVALGESAVRLKEAQRMAHIGSWEFDLASGALHWSDEVYRIFGVDPAQVTPSFARFLECVHPDDRNEVNDIYKKSVRNQRRYNHVHRLLLADGQVKYVRELGVTEYDGERPVRSVGTVQDITEVRAAQQALQQLNEELEWRVTERTRELAQLNRELEAFAYSVSHDLRTPLRSIHGFACVLEEDEAPAMSDEGRKHLRRIQDGSRRMGQLITDLLSLAHLSRAAMKQVPVNLSELALAVAGELQRSEPEREVDWHIDEGLQAVADPGLMRVVLHNLLGNAWKYTSQTPNARIAFTEERRADGMTTFCVRDNGAGFDMAYAAQLFQPFRRLHAHHEFEGSGVGLATVSRVIRRHGGQVRGEGAVGQGAAFYFGLPEVAVPSDMTTW